MKTLPRGTSAAAPFRSAAPPPGARTQRREEARRQRRWRLVALLALVAVVALASLALSLGPGGVVAPAHPAVSHGGR